MSTASVMEKITGVIFDIQHVSLVDGPGMRSTVFLKGCPLRCRWCHNPEAIRPQPEEVTHRNRNSEREWCGRVVSMEEVISEIAGESDYYTATGGGVTISGGEPLFQSAFTTALLQEVHARGIHACLDTSGFVSRAALEEVLPFTDLFLFDYKATGTARHQELTGVEPERILKNLEFLIERNARIILRCPMVPDVNDTHEHFEAIARISQSSSSIQSVDILPYHHWAKGKALPLWCPDWGLDQPSASEADRERWKSLLASTGCLHASIR